MVGPAFFTTMQIPILAGRDFDERDRPGSPAVAVINEVFAKAQFRRSESARPAPDAVGAGGTTACRDVTWRSSASPETRAMAA